MTVAQQHRAAIAGAWRRVAAKSPRQLAQIAARRLVARTGADELDMPLRDADVWDSSRALRPARPGVAGAPRRIGWVVVPPTPGSGGHTTLFRMIAAAERAGHRSTLLFYDRYAGDFATNVRRVRQGWPWLRCEIRDVFDPLTDLDVLVASAWQTAHVLATRSADLEVARFALLQDYEPDFYAHGAIRALAEDAHRFGIDGIALGGMVAERLRAELGVESRVIPYGTDRGVYRLSAPERDRRGVAFFAKAGNDRRGYRLGVLTLRELQRVAPEVPVHVYGDRLREPGLRVHNHGYLRPDELAALYNRVCAGLVLSFTNPSLVPAELAASGAVPVMNDLPGARAVLDNPHMSWAPATPAALARALVEAVQAVDSGPERSRALAAWPTPTWDDTARELLSVIAPSAPRRHGDAAPEGRP